MTSAIAVTGLGIVSAFGQGCDRHLQAFVDGTCGLAPCSDEALPLAASLPVGRVTTKLPAASGRTAALAFLAAEEALADLPRSWRRQLSICIGNCTGGMRGSEAAYLQHRQEHISTAYRHQQTHRCSQDLAAYVGSSGPLSTHSVACASSACAMIDAIEQLRHGLSDRVLVVGSDALCRVTMSGFHSLRVIDPAGCRPLTEHRAGMSLGEGAAALLLEKLDRAQERQANIQALALGWGLQADAYHATAPRPDGHGLSQAILQACADADITPDSIDYINAHGTGTQDNDAVEAKVYAQHCPQAKLASSKGAMGHTMGAAAAIEAVATCLAVKNSYKWGSVGAEAGTTIRDLPVQIKTETGPIKHALSSSLAFGGVNAVLAFGPAP